MKTLLRTLSSIPLFVLPALPLRAQQNPCPPPVSHISMVAGTYSSRPGVTFHLRHFDALLVPVGKSAPTCYQKTTVVAHADIFVSNDSLTHVFAEKLGASDSKIKDLKVENGVGKVTLSGRITKIVPIEFVIEGTVTTDGTSILLDASKIKADGIPIKLLLSMIGEHLNSIMKMKNVAGVSVTDNRLSFSPEQLAHLKGHLESVETSAEGLTLHYTKGPAKASKPTTTPSR